MIPNDFRWSFSKIEAFCTCPMMFKLQYLDGSKQDDNCFSEYGTLCHTLLEEYFKGELMEFELVAEYEARYDKAVPHPFPPYPKGFGQKSYDLGYEYFDHFEGLPANFEIVEVEDKFVLDLDGNTFVGIADLIIRDKETGDYIVWDHKTKSDKSMKKSLATFKKQLYLYAHHVKEKYGQFPAKMYFNMIKTGEMLKIPFDEGEYREALQWVTDMIRIIKSETAWKPKDKKANDYFCTYLCGVWNDCINGGLSHDGD